jgi:hypothetical protein
MCSVVVFSKSFLAEAAFSHQQCFNIAGETFEERAHYRDGNNRQQRGS